MDYWSSSKNVLDDCWTCCNHFLSAPNEPILFMQKRPDYSFVIQLILFLEEILFSFVSSSLPNPKTTEDII